MLMYSLSKSLRSRWRTQKKCKSDFQPAIKLHALNRQHPLLRHCGWGTVPQWFAFDILARLMGPGLNWKHDKFMKLSILPYVIIICMSIYDSILMYDQLLKNHSKLCWTSFQLLLNHFQGYDGCTYIKTHGHMIVLSVRGNQPTFLAICSVQESCVHDLWFFLASFQCLLLVYGKSCPLG